MANKYYQTDTPKKQIDVIDVAGGVLDAALAPGVFAGNNTVRGDMSHNGPNGTVYVPGSPALLYVGDVNAVQIINTSTGALTKTLTLSKSGVRVDEGCYDPDDQLVLFASPEETPAFINFISTKTQTVVAKYVFSPDTQGLDACVYDSGTKSFLINNDGTNANPDGEVDVFTAASAVAGTPALSNVFPLPSCSPTGMALGPNTDVLIGCNQSAPLPTLFSYILNRTNGSILATPAIGGEDQVAYDSVTNRYFIPAAFNQANGVPDALGTTVPVLAVVDGTSRQILYEVPEGYAGHGVAIDGPAGLLFVPHAAATATQGLAFPLAGVTIYTTH